MKIAGLTSCLLLAAGVQAQTEVAARSPYVTAGATVDGDDNSNRHVEFGLPLGRLAWMYAGVGQQESSGVVEDLSADVVNAGLGFGGKHWEFATGYVQRKDGAFKQDDWLFALEWRGASAGLGADLFLRGADDETIASIERRRRAPLTARIVESLDATGYGLHGYIDVSDQWTVFANAMTYDYEDVETNHPVLSRLLYQSGSGVTRDQAFLDQSFGLGASYRFATVAVTMQYWRDETLQTHDVTDTGQLAAVVLLGEHWSLTPTVGYSDSEVDDGTLYGGLAIGYTW